MELVSTKPTKPTCRYVLNKRLFIFFCLFLFITGVYDGVRDDKERDRERERERERESINQQRRETEGRRQQTRETKRG